ncbi:MAG: general secretion pathway protein GspK [Opitutales bacterium]
MSASKAQSFRRGSVLVAVLGMIFIASLMITLIIERAIRDISYRGLHDNRPDLQREAYSAMMAGMAALAEIKLFDGKLYGPQQGWSAAMSQADYTPSNGYEVNINIEDESGKLPLNEANAEGLRALLIALEISEFDIDLMLDTLFDWIDADDQIRANGAEDETYERKDPVYRPANAPLATLDDLRLIEHWDEAFFDEEGQSNAIFQEFSRCVSLYNQGKVNVHTAPQFLLEALAYQDGTPIDSLLDYLLGPDGEANTGDETPIADASLNPLPESESFRAMTTDVATVVQMQVSVGRGDVRSSLVALLDLSETDSLPGIEGTKIPLPFKVLSIRENQRF